MLPRLNVREDIAGDFTRWIFKTQSITYDSKRYVTKLVLPLFLSFENVVDLISTSTETGRHPTKSLAQVTSKHERYGSSLFLDLKHGITERISQKDFIPRQYQTCLAKIFFHLLIPFFSSCLERVYCLWYSLKLSPANYI
jgi:hypothetical protein